MRTLMHDEQAPEVPGEATPANPTQLDLHGQSIVIVGGTSGIGKTLALGLQRLGARVAASSRREQEVSATADTLEAAGQSSTLRQTCDVTEPSSLEELVKATTTDGQVHALINCAGTTAKSASLDVPLEEWRRILDVNLTGTFLACQAFAPHMIERGYGRIVNIGSLASFVGLHQVAAYTASKAGVAGLTRALAVEWAPHGVCVNAIAPGVFRTELNRELLDGTERGREFKLRTPLQRFGHLDELVGAAAFLCSPSASFVCGEVLKVDGGFLASGVNQ